MENNNHQTLAVEQNEAAASTGQAVPTTEDRCKELETTKSKAELALSLVSLENELAKTPFNPFTKLGIKELVALTGRYTKAWRVAHSVDIALAQVEFNCTADEACFYADLKGTANSIIDRETITEVGDSIAGLVRGIGTAQKEISLNLIKADYEALKPELQNEVGKRVRDVTNKTYESSTAAKLLGILYTHLGVVEKDWMR